MYWFTVFSLTLLSVSPMHLPRPSPRALSPEERASFHTTLLTDGYVRLRNILPSSEATAWGEKVLKASHLQTAGCDISSASVIQNCQGFRGPAFTRGRQLEVADPQLSALIHSPGLARIAAQAMNVSRVRLYQATSFLKSPGDAPSAWHQDAAACPLATDKLVTLWLALDDVPVEAAPLIFARGSHLPGVPIPSLRDLTPAQRLERMGKWTSANVSAAGLKISKPLHLSPGDATLHLGWTLHASPPNTHASLVRKALAITYFADGSKVNPNVLKLGGEAGVGKGVFFTGEDGKALEVLLLADDFETWKPWLAAKILIPGQPVRDNLLTPLLYDALWDTTRDKIPL